MEMSDYFIKDYKRIKKYVSGDYEVNDVSIENNRLTFIVNLNHLAIESKIYMQSFDDYSLKPIEYKPKGYITTVNIYLKNANETFIAKGKNICFDVFEEEGIEYYSITIGKEYFLNKDKNKCPVSFENIKAVLTGVKPLEKERIQLDVLVDTPSGIGDIIVLKKDELDIKYVIKDILGCKITDELGQRKFLVKYLLELA